MSENIPIVNRWCCKILPISDIVYIFSDYRKAEIHTRNEMIPVYYSRDFEMVSDMRDGVIRFRNGEEVSLGRGSYIKAKQKFAMYIKNNKKTLANSTYL